MIDVALVRNFTGITDISVISDEDINFYIDTAESEIVEHFGAPFKKVFASEKFDGDGTNSLKARHFPVITICNLFVNNISISIDKYYLDTDKNLIILKNQVFPIGTQNIQLDYYYGITEFSDPHLFNIARRLCLYLASRSVILATSATQFNISTEKLGEYSLKYEVTNIDRLRYLDLEIERLWTLLGRGPTFEII